MMQGMKRIGIFLTAVVMVALSGAIVHAEYHHVDDCAVCHYAGGAESPACVSCPNNMMIKCEINTPNSGLRGSVFGPYVWTEDPYNGVCEVCHTGTAYHRNNASGDHTHFTAENCILCHKHSDQFTHGEGQPCDTCHGHDGGAGTYQSHSTHTENDSDDLKGPHVGCPDCHDTNSYPDFVDGATGDTALADTTVCDNCHSPGGDFDGVNDPVFGAKANWESGVYDSQYQHLPYWQENTDYETGDIVLYGTPALVYVAKSTFTSPLGNPLPENWDQILDWQPNTAYETGDLAIGNEKAWRAVSDFTSGPAIPNGANWELVQRTGAGKESLPEGKENWCATCHDDQPAYSKPDLNDPTGVKAPNVLGDGSIYGFYVSGHGRPGIDQQCLDCHNSTFVHIDHKHRTYEMESINVVRHAYKDSYRLKEDMRIPRRTEDTIENSPFKLCMDTCHEPHAGVLEPIETCETSFRDGDGGANNQYHTVHLGGQGMMGWWDSDWSGSPGDWGRTDHQDSAISCPACHNVHGSPMMVNGTLKSNPVMTRHGELISSPDSQDKVPAIDIRWEKSLPPPGGGTTETNVREESDRGFLSHGGLLEDNYICETCHTGGYYYRSPGGSPKILDTYYVPMTIRTTDFENNDKDLFSPGEGIRYHLDFYLTGAVDGTEYCVQSQDSGAYNNAAMPGADWGDAIAIDAYLPRGQHAMYWDRTIPLNAEASSAKYRIELRMGNPACDLLLSTVTKTHDFSIQFQDPNDPPLSPTLTPEADTTDPAVTLEWSEVLCPDGDGLQYYVEVSDCEDFGGDPCVHYNSGWQPEPPDPPETHFDITLPVGTWHWRAKARDSGHTDRESSWSYPDSFEVQESSSTPPPAPTPTPAADTNTVSVTLEWGEVTCPDGNDAEYYAEVDSTLFFTSPYSSGWQLGTSWEVTLPNTTTPTTWLWRVKARDSVHTYLESSWSSSDFFERTLSPGPFLNDKENVTSTVPVEVPLTWVAYGSFANTPEYYVQVNDAADFTGSSNYTSGWLSGEEWNVTLDANVTWYWRVKARDSVDTQLESFWSDSDSFDIGPYIIRESFEAGSPGSDSYGYELQGWAETVGLHDCEVQENSSVQGAPPVSDFGSMCLESKALGNTYAAFSDYSYSSEQAVTYTSFWVYVASEDVEHYEYKPLLVMFDGTGNTVFDFGLYAQWNHQINFRIRDWDSSGIVRGQNLDYGIDAPELISMNTWYHIGMKYKYWDNGGGDEGYSWEWSIDGVPVVSVRDPAPYEDPFGRPMWPPLHGIQQWRVGFCHSVFDISSQPYPGVAYFDKFEVSTKSFDIFMPTLIPEPDTTDPVPATVTLEWNAVTSPGGSNVEYHVQLDDDYDFSSPEHESGWQTGTSFNVSGLGLGTWHWRVMAQDQVDHTLKSDWSRDSFDVHRPPPTPTLIPEPDISEPVPVSVTLEWNAVTDPDGDPVEYYVEMDDAPDFSSPDFTSGWISGTQWSAANVTAGTWHWYVKARDAAHIEGESARSDPDSFEVIANSLVIEESFEGAGYELTWTESVGSGCIVDEDHTPIPDNPPDGLGSECLRTQTGLSADHIATATYDHGTELSRTFTTFYVNVNLPLPAYFADGDTKDIGLFLDGLSAEVFRLQIHKSGTQMQLQLHTGTWTSLSRDISLDTWYRIDVKYDRIDNLWEWLVDNTVADSGTLTSGHKTGIRYWSLGPLNVSQEEYVGVYFDLVSVDTECFAR
jgi:hypothetical protein